MNRLERRAVKQGRILKFKAGAGLVVIVVASAVAGSVSNNSFPAKPVKTKSIRIENVYRYDNPQPAAKVNITPNALESHSRPRKKVTAYSSTPPKTDAPNIGQDYQADSPGTDSEDLKPEYFDDFAGSEDIGDK